MAARNKTAKRAVRNPGGTRTKTAGRNKTKRTSTRTATKQTPTGTKTSGKRKVSRTRSSIGPGTSVATRGRARRSTAGSDISTGVRRAKKDNDATMRDRGMNDEGK
jgi:hypothetical protein